MARAVAGWSVPTESRSATLERPHWYARRIGASPRKFVSGAVRELLAKFIIAMVQQGEKNPKRLVDDALLRLRIILRHDAVVDGTSKSNKSQNEQVLPDLPPTSAFNLRVNE